MEQLDANPPHEISREVVKEHLARVLRSNVFSGAQTLSRFLEFLVSRVLLDKQDRIKEYVVGTEVFGRKASFDPRIDPIVRVEARRLRTKIQTYYETEGRYDQLRIDIPKGGYSPRFSEVRLKKACVTADYSPLTGKGHSLAVLPFVSLGPDVETATITSGIVEELIRFLTAIEGLAVVSFTSALFVKSQGGCAQKMGKALAAHMLVEGSVRVAAGQVRIFVRLVNSSSGYVVWSQRYDREYKDILLMEEQVCRAVAGVLKTEMLPNVRENSESNVTVPPGKDAVA